MSKSQLDGMYVKGAFYSHFINLDTDATTIENESGDVIYTVDSSAVAYDRAGKIGQFYTDSDSKWYFQGLSKIIVDTEYKNLLKAEMQVFKQFLEQ